jgi:hypothetical protein
VVGSLLRPTSLRYAVEEFYSGGHSAVLADERARDRTELRALEDEAIRDAMRRQIDLGLDVITDGEFRRWMFLNSFYDAVEGLRVHEIVDHLRLVDSPAAREAAFMSAVADGYPFKITFPAPSLFRAPVLVQARRDLRLRVARGVRRARDPDRTPSCRRRDQGGHAVRAVRLVIFR